MAKRIEAIGPLEDRLEGFLGPLESRVRAIVVERGNASVAEVHAVLSQERDLAYTTVLTILSRLTNKGMLARVKRGRRFVYSATTVPNKDSTRRIRQLMSGLINAFGGVAIRSFVESASEIDEATLHQLELELAKARAKKAKKKK